ncbi:MAG: hypothetical protein A2736_01830 [Candidatus Yanofskybacteria bacterium RIFCSPHIGHO2_01_FULL_41_27]|uniref:Uncharacterized protein n=2 Tax=Candidatus Yanofskyibacteriota TaxID=1752733 RepID=A0A1F8HU63_9BACT|nr:MAG: hypothetical protein A2736_01830 [Candidatus Yanofskybacteria bacterium RIFCSPHIGHO2_01_FULL_41_27]OGN21784.1 MAG: hypothetical protein A3B00_02925 [Candidatus Yanofskybacteria bacterium RIFCSPLOWO2_01_FULL_41_33]OGN41123.1 MAG: hypothetical protein A2606_00560 [Candidatus Yanofskybacteria bacterium RIFOXYD1_FULL_42_10]
MYGLQKSQLLYRKKQEEGGAENRIEEVLQMVQEAYFAQRGQNYRIKENKTVDYTVLFSFIIEPCYNVM